MTLARMHNTQLNAALLADPGFMTVVPCAATPGLELLDAATMEWISVCRALVLLINDFTTSPHLARAPTMQVERTGRPHKDVALFCGQSLQTVSEGVYPGTACAHLVALLHAAFSLSRVHACGGACHPGIVHCVGKSKRPRLSLVYELRPALHD